MLYLLCHLVGSRGLGPGRGVSPTPWTGYARFLPRSVPVPSMWSEPERLLLNGTSLEVRRSGAGAGAAADGAAQAALEAKLAALAREFDELRAQTEALPFWSDFLWRTGGASAEDWVLVDAWYRSRSLELPHVGHAMVPVVDMANHSASATACYDVDGDGDVVLLVRAGCGVAAGDEVTISYGEAKPAAEMLFNYGFVDEAGAAGGMTLRLEPFDDDPLAKAKLHVFGAAPTLRLRGAGGGQAAAWESAFAHLMVLNEEDGLGFGVLQDGEGGRQLRMLWQGEDATARAGDAEALVRGHELAEVLRLRAVAVVLERVEAQLAEVRGGPSDAQLQTLAAAGMLNEPRMHAAAALRAAEARVLEAAAAQLGEQVRTYVQADGGHAAGQCQGRRCDGLTRGAAAAGNSACQRPRGGIPRIEGRWRQGARAVARWGRRL